MQSKVIALFIANIIAFAVIGLSYVFYSKLLSPKDFGLYSVALVIGSLSTLILDGGLKSTIIKHRVDLTKEEESSLLFFMSISSIVVFLFLWVIRNPLTIFYPSVRTDFSFLLLFAAIYLFSYPFISIPTAILERRLEYGKIAWIESIGVMLERGSPVLLIIGTNQGMYSFIWGAFLGRLFRVISINYNYRPKLQIVSFKQLRKAFNFIGEGIWFQIALLASLLRDNLHIIMIGPLYGKEWIGYYAWGLQLCMIASQAFVQISARVSLPLFAKATTSTESWQSCAYQIKILTILTTPILISTLLIIPGINEHFFKGKWDVAICLLPMLFSRMLPGLATTPVGTLLLVNRGARIYAKTNLIWTFFEVVSAYLLVMLVGPSGLAWSYAVVVWLGLGLILLNVDKKHNSQMRLTFGTLFKRPSLWVSLFIIAPVLILPTYRKAIAGANDNYGCVRTIIFALIVISVSYFSEGEIRQQLKRMLLKYAHSFSETCN